MATYQWRGVTTLRIYAFDTTAVPGELVDANGTPLQVATYTPPQGPTETVVICNRDGSVARGVAGPNPTPYDPGYAPSPWERQ